MYYTRMPLTMLTPHGEETPRIERIRYEGRWLRVAVEGEGQAVILSSFSSDPRDYLDPRFKPGKRLVLPNSPK